MRKIALPLVFLGALGLAGAAYAAKSWNLLNEEEASFEATVVDMICELTGDCPQECGVASDRQLGLVDGDGKLILVAKNLTFFAGGSMDLAPYCGQAIEVDGFTDEWVEREGFDPAGEERKKWWNNDPRVLEIIEQDGVLGLGHEVDEEVFGGE